MTSGSQVVSSLEASQVFEMPWAAPVLEYIVDAGLSGGSSTPIRVQEICDGIGANDAGDLEMVKRTLRYLGEKQLIDVAISSGDGDPNYLMMVRRPTALGIDRVSERRSTLTVNDERVLKTVAELEASGGQGPSTSDVASALVGSPGEAPGHADSIRRLVRAGLLEGHDATNQSSPYAEYVDLRVTLLGTDRLGHHPPASQPSTVVNIYGGSTVGQVNFGQVIGNIETSIEVVTGLQADDLKRALTELLMAIRNDVDLSDSARAEALDQLEYIAEAATQSATSRRPSVLNAVLAKIPLVLAAGEASVKAWATFGPEIIRFLRT